MTDAEKEQLHQLLIKAADSLGEHFDSVRIFCTKQCGDSTFAINRGGGNHYASLGQIHEWIESDQARNFWIEKPETE